MIDLGALIRTWYRGKNRFETANPLDQVFSPYDIPGPLLEDMEGRQVKPFYVMPNIDLSTASQLVLPYGGFHVVMYGHDGSPNKAVNTTAFMHMWWGKKDGSNPFPFKHARGYSGIFRNLVFEWPAQSGVYADIVVHTGMHTPWIDGESAT